MQKKWAIVISRDSSRAIGRYDDVCQRIEEEIIALKYRIVMRAPSYAADF